MFSAGRWRPLQYFFAQSVFADVMATCGKVSKTHPIKLSTASPDKTINRPN
eukprot:COSAG06_NODE_1753_length_8461_cov_3.540770_5_plen_51_part_00